MSNLERSGLFSYEKDENESWIPSHHLAREYANWLVTPVDDRAVTTKSSWARSKGLTPQDLYTWDKNDKFQTYLSTLVELNEIDKVSISRVKSILLAKAEAGDLKSIELILKLTGELTERRETTIKDLSTISDEELNRLASLEL